MGKCKNNGFIDFLSEKHAYSPFEVECFSNAKEKIVIKLKRKDSNMICPECGEGCKPTGLMKRLVRDLDLIKKCYIEFEQAKIRCKCGYQGMEKLDFFGKKMICTQRFAKQFVAFTNASTIQKAAEIFRLEDRMADEIEKGYYLEAFGGKRHFR